MPTTVYKKAELDEGKDLITLLVETKLAASRSEGRRIILQGGVSVNDVKVTEIDRKFTSADLDADGVLLIKKGKKGIIKLRWIRAVQKVIFKYAWLSGGFAAINAASGGSL